MYDILNGKIALSEVTMSEWIDLTAMAMIEQHQPHLNLTVPYGGALYTFHHCIVTIKPPTTVESIMETSH